MKPETSVVIGEAKEKICEAAAKLEAHFLVVGSHGHCSFIRYLIRLFHHRYSPFLFHDEFRDGA